jgi:hypothetical protein
MERCRGSSTLKYEMKLEWTIANRDLAVGVRSRVASATRIARSRSRQWRSVAGWKATF